MKGLSGTIIIFLFLSLFSLWGNTLLEKARALEENNKKEEAATLYREWLIKNTRDEKFFDILTHYTLLEKNPVNLLSFVVPLIPKIEKREERADIYAICALIQELRGNIEEAIEYYIDASKNSREKKKTLFLLSAAELLFEQGDFDRTQKFLSSIINNPQKTEIQGRAARLYARTLSASGKMEEAEQYYSTILRNFKETASYPGILLGYCEHLYFSGKSEKALKVYEELKRSYNTCPEYFLAQKIFEDTETRIESYPGPSSYFLSHAFINTNGEEKKTESDPIDNTPDTFDNDIQLYIQTGSYVMRDNAEEMVKELKTYSIIATIIEKKIGNTLYYRVVVEVKEDETVNDAILRLKEAGYEGFLISQ